MNQLIFYSGCIIFLLDLRHRLTISSEEFNKMYEAARCGLPNLRMQALPIRLALVICFLYAYFEAKLGYLWLILGIIDVISTISSLLAMSYLRDNGKKNAELLTDKKKLLKHQKLAGAIQVIALLGLWIYSWFRIAF